MSTLHLDVISIFIFGVIFLNSVLIQNGISRTAIREENDYYATDPKAIDYLLRYEVFDKNIWECACGEGNLSEALKEYGYNVFSTDLIDRGYPDDIIDFLKTDIKFSGDIITNPPFKHATEFINKALEVIPYGNKVAMFMKLTYLSGKKRYNEIYSKFPPYKVYVFTGRIACSKNNLPEGFKGNAMDYAWFIWEKGKLGPTELKWIKM
jgi:hypothetical protein